MDVFGITVASLATESVWKRIGVFNGGPVDSADGIFPSMDVNRFKCDRRAGGDGSGESSDMRLALEALLVIKASCCSATEITGGFALSI